MPVEQGNLAMAIEINFENSLESGESFVFALKRKRDSGMKIHLVVLDSLNNDGVPKTTFPK